MPGLKRLGTTSQGSKFLPTGGLNIEGEDDCNDIGSGAGFYVDATEDKWKTNYRMYSYITKEVCFTATPAVIELGYT